jgi:hypothetical protein
MNNKVRQILDQITALEDELQAMMGEQEIKFHYQIHGKRVVFEQAIREAHKHVKLGVFRWFLTVRPQNYLTMPIIYSMIFPLALLDICISFYQAVCFPIYRIRKVRRSDYIVIDHQHLSYLNFIEKFHCMYCSYGNGLLGYAQEITARTEQYFCPIKHAHKILNSHSRYDRFLDYGAEAKFHEKLEEFRDELAKENENSPSN